MNEIVLYSDTLPVTLEANFLMAASSFVHADRILDFNVLIYVTAGQITVTEDNIDYEINPGELFFLKHHVHHYGKKQIHPGTSWYYIHFSIAKSSVNHSAFPTTVEASLLPGQNTNTLYSLWLPKHFTLPIDSTFPQMLDDFIALLHSNSPSNHWILNAKLFELLSFCALPDEASTQIPPSLSDQICVFLKDHYKEPFSAEALETHFFLSYKHMAAIFKKEKQLTMQQYHTSLRMNAACKLLRTTMLQIGEISETLGYHDMLYFSRCFHQHIGLSPSDYRKKSYPS